MFSFPVLHVCQPDPFLTLLKRDQKFFQNLLSSQGGVNNNVTLATYMVATFLEAGYDSQVSRVYLPKYNMLRFTQFF